MRVGPIYIEDDGGLTIATRDGLRRLTAQTLVEAVGVETLRGPEGDPGVPGPGLPAGGTAGQIPVKGSSTDYDTDWGDLPTTLPPTDGSVTLASLVAALKPSGRAGAADEAVRRLGNGAGEAAPGINAVGAVIYSGDARVARPTGYALVFWIFPTGVTPTNMAATDVLIETA